MSIVHPNSGLQHVSNAAPISGQHQLPLQQSSPPWWAGGPPPPPNPWNWNMWLSGAFHQLLLTNPVGQPTFPNPSVTPNQFLGHPPTMTPAISTVTSAPASAGTVQQDQLINDVPISPHCSPSVSSNSTSFRSLNSPDTTEEEQPDPLFSALAFLMAPSKTQEPLLSMHVSASIKKIIWAGQYVDLAYLLETQPVPNDDKAYEFSCSNSNTNKFSLTTAKPKAKVDSYNSWNKVFRVLTEIVALKWLDQCLPMVQYAAEISDNIGKFTFALTYYYDIKFRLKKQMKLALKLNEIDNSLWTKCFSGSGRDGLPYQCLITNCLQEK